MKHPQDHHSTATISPPATPSAKLGGSHPAARPRRAKQIDDDLPPDDFPDIEIPDDTEPPRISVPDIGLQFSPCLGAIPGDEDLEEAVLDAVRDALAANADARYLCHADTGRVGVWLRSASTDEDREARERGLEQLELLQTDEDFAFFINSSLIRRNAQDQWAETPKQLDGDGQPDPDGPTHLESLSISFESPNQVVTRIDGFDERPWPDVDFQAAITDTLSISGGQIQCRSESKLDTDADWLNALTVIFSSLTTLSWVFALPAAVFAAQRVAIFVGSRNLRALDDETGAGCGAAEMIPQEILIPLGLKIVNDYDRLEVASGGIFTGGTFRVTGRIPLVEIQGRSRIAAAPGSSSVTHRYELDTEELVPPLDVRWSGDGVPFRPGAESTGIRFNAASIEPGEVLTKRVEVHVTDRDGLEAQAEKIVRIHGRVLDQDDVPPVCEVKPWLPQCREPIARALERSS